MTPAALSIDDPAYFARLAEVETQHWWSRGMWRIAAWWLDAELGGRRGLHALDLGCGTGLGAVRLARRPEITRVVGLDASDVALAAARCRHAQPLVRGSALALPFGPDCFDVVTCFDVLQHLPAGTLQRAALELRRVLRPGGVAVLRSNTERDGSVLDRLREGFAEAGFVVVRATRVNCLPALGLELLVGLRHRDRNGHPAGRGLRIRLPHPWVNRAMGMITTAEAFAAGRLAARLPFGHSTMLLVRAGSSGCLPQGDLDAGRD
jgi:SAM-dependent methyltransferase